MRESRFIELLNLYVDHQLTKDDATELQAEIARDPVRRRTYHQYCRIQKACTELFEQERHLAPSSRLLSTSLSEADAKIQAGGRAPFSFAHVFYPVGVAAAACLAFGIMWRHQAPSHFPSSHPSEDVAVVIPAPKTSAQPAAGAEFVRLPVGPAARPSLYSVFATKPSTTSAISEDANTLADNSNPDALVSVSWMRNLDLAPLPNLNDRLTLKPSAPLLENRGLRVQRLNDATAENAAFQFRR